MLKRIKKLLLKQGVDLQEHKLVIPNYKRNKYAKYMYGAFAIIFAVYLVDLFTSIHLGINGLFVYIALTLLVLYPIATRTDNPYEALIITTEGLIMRTSRKEFLIIKYDNITKFRQDGQAVYLFEQREQMTLPKELYGEVLDKLIDILEAKGKTFDKDKDYMIRPVRIIIENGQIRIEDIKQEATETEKMTEKLFRTYPHLTPGYLEEVIPRNTIIYDVKLDGPHLKLICSKLEIRGNHPENTTFDHIMVSDSILIFLDAEIVELSARDTNERAQPYDKVPVNKKNLVNYLKDSVVDDWKYDVRSALFINKAGLGNVRLRVKYSEVIVGWKKQK